MGQKRNNGQKNALTSQYVWWLDKGMSVTSLGICVEKRDRHMKKKETSEDETSGSRG